MVSKLTEVPTNFIKLSFFLSMAATSKPTPAVKHEKYIVIVIVAAIEIFGLSEWSFEGLSRVAMGYDTIEKNAPHMYSQNCDSQNDPDLVRDSLAMLAIAENMAMTSPATGAKSHPFVLSPEGTLKRRSPAERKQRDIHAFLLLCRLTQR
jgi:hypothetical protein